MSNRFKIFLFILFIASAALITGIYTNGGFSSGDGYIIVASVGSSKLTDRNLLEMVSNPEVDKYRLKLIAEGWVNREILARSAEKADLSDDEMLSYSLENYKREFLANVYLQDRFRQMPFVKDREILNFYNNNIESYLRDEKQIRAYHFLLDDETTANDLKDALNTSDENKMSLILNNYHGTLRTFGRNDVIEEISSNAFGSRRDIVGPIVTEYGYHVLQILDRFESESLIPIHEVKDEIIQKIKIRKQNILYYEIIDSLRLSVDYYINESYLNQ